MTLSEKMEEAASDAARSGVTLDEFRDAAVAAYLRYALYVSHGNICSVARVAGKHRNYITRIAKKFRIECGRKA